MTVIDFDFYRTHRLTIETHAVDGLAGVIKWTLTCKQKSTLQKALGALNDIAVHSTFTPVRKAGCNWQAVGYTSEYTDLDSLLRIRLEGEQN